MIVHIYALRLEEFQSWGPHQLLTDKPFDQHPILDFGGVHKEIKRTAEVVDYHLQNNFCSRNKSYNVARPMDSRCGPHRTVG